MYDDVPKIYPNSDSLVPELPRCDPTNGKVMLVSPLQPENALDPMLVTLDGIVTEVSLLQPENALSPILATLDGIVTEVSPSQPQNAHDPMLVTPLGIVTTDGQSPLYA